MIQKAKRVAILSLIIAVGAGAFSLLCTPQAFGASSTAMCYRGATITVPNTWVAYYQSKGATIGACPPVSGT